MTSVMPSVTTTMAQSARYITYKLLGEKVSLKAELHLAKEFSKSKCGKYVHFGMELAEICKFNKYDVRYNLIKYSDD